MRPLAQILEESDLHLLALHEAMARIPAALTPDHFMVRDPDLIAALDQFAYRFAKLQDVMSIQLFRAYAVAEVHAPVEESPVIDILKLLERYQLIPSVTRWQQIREMRNQITHEYAMQVEELIAAITQAFTMVDEMQQIVRGMKP